MYNYENIIKNLELGKYVQINDKDDTYMIIYPFKDCDGDFRTSFWENSLDECFKSLEKSRTIFKDFKEVIKNVKEILILSHEEVVEKSQGKIKRFKAGEKVYIRKDAKEINERCQSGWHNNMMDDMVGKVLEVKEVFDNDYTIWNNDKSNYWFFPEQVLQYPIKDTEDKEEMTLSEVCKELGRDVKIIKE